MGVRTDSSSFTGRYRAGLLLLCLLSFALRLYRLEDLFLSDDEMLSYSRYVQQPIAHIFTDYQANNHWLINLLGHVIGQGGTPYTLLRWPSVWFGTLAIPLIGVAGQWFFRSRQVGFVAALLLTVSAFHLQWSQQFRGYSLLLFWSLFALVCLWLALRRGRSLYWGGLLLAMLLTAASHLFGALTLCVIIALLIGQQGRSFIGPKQRPIDHYQPFLLILIGLALTISLAWIGKSYVINVYHPPPTASLGQLIVYQWQALSPTLPDINEFLTALAVAFTTQRQPGAALLLFWTFSLTGLLISRRQFPQATPFLAVCLLLPISLVILAEFVIAGFFVFDRFLLASLPVWLILVAGTLVGGSRWLARRQTYLGILFLAAGLGYLALLNLSLTQAYFTYRVNHPWRDVAAYLAHQAGPNDLILCHRLPHQIDAINPTDDLCQREISQRLQILSHTPQVSVQPLAALMTPAQQPPLPDRFRNVWLVLWGESGSQNANPAISSEPALATGVSRRITFARLTPITLLHRDRSTGSLTNSEYLLRYLAALDTTSPERFDYYLRLAELLAYRGQLVEAHAAFNTAQTLALSQAETPPQLAQTYRFLTSFNRPTAKPQQRLSIDFGQPARLRLTGYTVPRTVQPAQTMPVTLFWQVVAPLPDDYTIFLHLRDSGGQTVAQLDFRPFADTYPTSQWPLGPTITETRYWTLPPDLPAKTYTLHSGLYQADTLTHLPVTNRTGERAAFLGQVRVVPAAADVSFIDSATAARLADSAAIERHPSR